MVSCGADSDAPSSARVLGLGDDVDGDGERWSAAADDDGRGSGDGGDKSAAAAAAAAAAPASSSAARSIRGRRPPRLPSLFSRGPRAAFAAPSARFGSRARAACSAAEPSVGGALSVGFSGDFGGEEDEDAALTPSAPSAARERGADVPVPPRWLPPPPP